MFPLRIVALLFCMATTWTMFSTVCFYIPGLLLLALCNKILVTFGRFIIRSATGLQNVHDLYTVFTSVIKEIVILLIQAGCGLYVIWSILRVAIFLYEWFKMDTTAMRNSVKTCLSLVWVIHKDFNSTFKVTRCSIILFPTLLVVPFLLGTFFQLIFVGPLRLDSNQASFFG